MDSWTPPTFDISKQPTLVRKGHLLPDQQFPENFARSAKWSVKGSPPHVSRSLTQVARCPDGSLALAHCENRSLQYLDMWVIIS
jgi:telomerase Cajal body protein 1